jgi:hypothetical protein
MNGGLSVYNDELCTSVSSQMHEIGHNLNLGHSSQGNDKYGDQTGMMGYSYRSSETPKMCFNAAKAWQLGWYEDKSESFSPGKSGWGYEQTFSIGSIVDYSDNNNNNVLIEIPQPNLRLNYYIGFNAAKGFNSGVREGINKVLVFEKPWIDGNDSLRQADLNGGEAYTIFNFDGVVGNFLKITVVGINYQTSVAEIFIQLIRTRTTEPTSSPTRDVGARDPGTGTGTGTPNCQGSFEQCSADNNDCCPGYACRRVATSDGGLNNVCRATAKQSKDKLPRASLSWGPGGRRLRGDAAAGPQPDDLLLEDSA